ncbi:MAG: hypothetical protein FWE06_00075 [Oscillospiraceae bacterium]|nr:hypothetical protein [Oscillospiraceae bacterium]
MKKVSRLLCMVLIFISIPLTAAAARMVEDYEMTVSFAFGDRTGIFSGMLDEDGLPQGFGRFESVNPSGLGWIYEGELVDGQLHGQGTITWENGDQEVGEFYNSLLRSGYRRDENLSRTLSIRDGVLVIGVWDWTVVFLPVIIPTVLGVIMIAVGVKTYKLAQKKKAKADY